MLCCFGRPSSPTPAKETLELRSARTAVPARSQDEQQKPVGEKPPCLPPGLKVGRPPTSAPVGSPNGTLATLDQELTEPWRDQLSQRLSSYVASNDVRAAGCWVLYKEKCFLVAAAPTYASRFRAMLHGYFVGSSIDLQADRESSVALALSSKTAVVAVFPAGGPAPSDVPADLRQLSERLGRAVSCVRPAPSGAAPAQTWHLAALPLLSSGEAVGVLVVAAQGGEAEATTHSPSASGPGAAASHAVFAASLTEDFFGTLDGRRSAKNVCALIAAVTAAPDHASAIREASAQVHAHLAATEPQLPCLCVTPAVVVSKNATRCSNANGCSSTATTTAAAANAGPQLQLYCNPSGKPVVVPVSETLMARAPVRADTLAAILTEALAAPVSSAALAAARTAGAPNGACRPATGPGQHHHQQQQQKRVVLQCPEDELPSSQCSELAVLAAARARATRGSVVLVSCPLSSILCAVVLYVSVAPPEACSTGPSAALTDGVAGEMGSSDQAAQENRSQHAVQLARSQLDRIAKLVASDVEVVASALEQRMISSCLPLTLTPVRHGSKGSYILDVNADTSGQLTVSVAATEAADDSNGFWGSASGNILSSELSGSTFQSGAGGSTPCGGGAPGRSHERASHILGMTARAAPLASPLGLSSSPARSADGDEAAAEAVVKTLAALPLRPSGPAVEAAPDGHAAPATTAATGEPASSPEPQGPCGAARGPAAAGAQVDSKAHREPWSLRGPGVLVVRGHAVGDVTTPEDTEPDNAGARGCDAAVGGATTGVSSAALATVSYSANATTTSGGTWPAPGGPANGSRDAAPAPLSLSLRPDMGASPNGCVLAPGPGSGGALPPTGKGSGSLPLAAVVAAAVRGRPVTCAAPSAPTAVVLPRTPPPGLMRCVSAGPGGTGGIVQQLGVSSTLGSHENGHCKPPMEPFMAVLIPSDAGGVRSFGSSGGGAQPGAASGSIGHVTSGMFRHRSKDWSDQAGESGETDARTMSAAPDGSTAPARMLPVKVLSADKAALQLPRTASGSTHGGALPAPVVPHVPYTSIAALELRDAAAAGYQTASAGSTGTAPRPYVAHMPRRLNRMYLPPPPASGAFPAGVGVPLSPASVVTSAAMLAGSLAASATPTPSVGSPAASISQTTTGPGSHSGDSVGVRVLNTLPASAAGVPPQGMTRPAPTAACAFGPSPASVVLGMLPRPVDPQVAASRTLHGLQLHPTAAAAWPASVPSLEMPPAPPPRLPPPSPGSLFPAPDGAALATVSASAPGAKNRQLSDYAIPEDAPLESTVSETVQMMRMLSQARGMHLSARMRRVRVTAKIQSAHPGALPANLPSQLARVALADADGLFAPGVAAPAGAGGAVAGSWVLTGVAARRGCVELVFDMILVRGGEAAGAAAPLGSETELRGVQSAAAARARRGQAPSGARQVSSPHPHLQPGSHHHVSSGGGYVSFSQAQGAQPHAQGYRRWQGAEALAGSPMCELADGMLGAPYPEMEAAGGALQGGGFDSGDLSASEQQWIRSSCGLRPEALGDVFQQCGLLSPATDPWVEVQVGHSPTGVATLLWHAASEQWVVKSSAPPSPVAAAGSGSATQQPQPSCHPSAPAGAVAGVGVGAPGTLAPLEAPTLWLPCAVALLPQGAHVLEHVRVMCKGAPGPGEVDELTVRSAGGYLPMRVSGGLRTDHGQGAAQSGGGAGSSSAGVRPLPLLLDEDPVAEQLAEGDCCWRSLDVLGPLPREGGLLLVESRRSRAPTGAAAEGNVHILTGCRANDNSRVVGRTTATAAGPCDADATSAAVRAASQTATAVTSAPVPLVLLSEGDAAAAAELQSLRSYMARLLLGSDNHLRSMGAAAVTPEAAAAAGAAAAQVEMACQQFLMDLGLLLDAAAAVGSGAPSLPGRFSSTLLGVAPSIAAAPSSMDAGAAAAAAAPPAPRVVAQTVSFGPNSLGEPSHCGGRVSAVITAANHSQSRPPTKGSELLASPACGTDALSSMPFCSSPLNKVGGMSEGDMLSMAGSSTAAAFEHAGGLWSFAEDMKTLLSPLPQSPPTPISQLGCQHHFLQQQLQQQHLVQQQRQVRDSVSGGALGAGPCSNCSVGSAYSDHLLDVACTLLTGCCAAGMRETALLVLCLAASKLALASPQALLVEASADPRVMMDLLTAFSFRPRASRDSSRNCGAGSANGVASAVAAVAAAPAAAAAGGSAGGRVAPAPLPGPRTPAEAAEGLAGGAADWSTAADSNAAVTSSLSHSHSLAVMLGGCRSSATPTLALPDDAAALGTQDGDSWVGHAVVDGEVEIQEDAVARPPPGQQRQEGDGHAREATAQAAAWEVMKAGAAQSALTPPVANMHAMAVCIGGVHSSITSDLPTWESMSSSAPDSGLAPDYSRGASPTRGYGRVCTEEHIAEAPAAPAAANGGAGAAGANGAAELGAPLVVSAPVPVRTAAVPPPVMEVTAVTPAPMTLAPAPAAPAPTGRMPSSRSSLAGDDASFVSGSSSTRSSGAGCSKDPAPGLGELEAVAAVVSEPNGAPAAAALQPGAGVGASGGRFGALCFQDPQVEADYMRFVANRTCGIIWSYFVYVTLISAVSCTRAWMEDGLPGCVTLLLFSGAQGVLMGWYCIAHDAREPWAMVAAAVGCKAIRMLADLLMGLHVLKVPSLMEPFAVRGVEVFTEALMRPIAERVSLLLFCTMLLLELPCVWLLYRHFHDIFPQYWLRDYPFLRTLIYSVTSLAVNMMAELYWRTEYRRWCRSASMGAGAAVDAHGVASTVVNASSAIKLHLKAD